MAARPFLRAFRAKLKVTGGWTALLERIADGATLTTVAREYQCSPSWLCHQLRDYPERRALYQEAQKIGATINVDRAEDALAGADVTNRESVTQAKLMAEHLRWKAARYDKEQFGETQAPGVTVNVQSLSLDALRWREIPATVEQAALPASTD